MNQDFAEYSAAVAGSFSLLSDLQTVFIDAVSTSDEELPGGQSMRADDDGSISGDIFGIYIGATTRPVVIDGVPVANEWTFHGIGHESQADLLILYQLMNNHLRLEPSDESTFVCQGDNPYLLSNLMELLVPAVIGGPFFRPQVSARPKTTKIPVRGEIGD